jgi:hypothetical protein
MSSEALTVLGIGVAVLGVVVAIVAILFADALKVPVVQQRIRCTLVSTARALSATVRGPVKYGDKESENPYIAVIEIANIGRREIPQDLFSENERGEREGIEFDVGVPIIDIVSARPKLENSVTPQLSVEDYRLILKPGLIAKGQAVNVTLLTEGPIRYITVTQNPFGNVKIDPRNYEEDRGRRRAWGFRTAWGALSVGIVAIVIVGANHLFDKVQSAAGNSFNSELDSSFNKLTQGFDCVLAEPIFRDAMLSLNLAFRDINVERDGQDKPVAMHFSSTYPADVKEASLDAATFVYDYDQTKAGGAASSLATPSNIPSATEEAVIALKRLPNEGISKANLDIRMISNTMNRLSALSALSLWCNGAYTHALTPSGTPSRRS